MLEEGGTVHGHVAVRGGTLDEEMPAIGGERRLMLTPRSMAAQG
jgi:hypothetical protein